eukprot:544273-Pleurochrysis_carterae.AAC.3
MRNARVSFPPCPVKDLQAKQNLPLQIRMIASQVIRMMRCVYKYPAKTSSIAVRCLLDDPVDDVLHHWDHHVAPRLTHLVRISTQY